MDFNEKWGIRLSVDEHCTSDTPEAGPRLCLRRVLVLTPGAHRGAHRQVTELPKIVLIIVLVDVMD